MLAGGGEFPAGDARLSVFGREDDREVPADGFRRPMNSNSCAMSFARLGPTRSASEDCQTNRLASEPYCGCHSTLTAMTVRPFFDTSMSASRSDESVAGCMSCAGA